VSERRHLSARDGGLSERERTKIEGRFGNLLALLFVAVFFSIAAPEGPWAFLLTTAVLAITLAIAMLASGVRRKVVRAWLGVAVLGVGFSVSIVLTQETRIASGYLAITSLLLTLATIGYGDLTAQGGLGRALAVT
jgi:4-amino-4-deoxy-L-arabinose transferase-like glycosyltransferase